MDRKLWIWAGGLSLAVHLFVLGLTLGSENSGAPRASERPLWVQARLIPAAGTLDPTPISPHLVSEPAPAPDPAPANPSPPASASSVPITTEAQFLEGPDPLYPPAARRAGLSGEVDLELKLDAGGHILEIHPLTVTHAIFLPPALEAARSTRFSPARRGGTATPGRFVLHYHFQLEKP